MTNIDAMGYNARTTDPLYKHIPFYLTWKKQSKISFGLFYDTIADCTFDLGRELDNYHGLYRYFLADYGDLDYYFIAGETLADVVRRYTWLTGRPAFTPKWSLGYSGSTMTYTDLPNAQERMNDFLTGCKSTTFSATHSICLLGIPQLVKSAMYLTGIEANFPTRKASFNIIWMLVFVCVPISNLACCVIIRALKKPKRMGFLSEMRMANRIWSSSGTK